MGVPKLERHIVAKVTVYGSLNGFVRCLVYCKYIPLKDNRSERLPENGGDQKGAQKENGRD